MSSALKDIAGALPKALKAFQPAFLFLNLELGSGVEPFLSSAAIV
jgi:hypothetical protein